MSTIHVFLALREELIEEIEAMEPEKRAPLEWLKSVATETEQVNDEGTCYFFDTDSWLYGRNRENAYAVMELVEPLDPTLYILKVMDNSDPSDVEEMGGWDDSPWYPMAKVTAVIDWQRQLDKG